MVKKRTLENMTKKQRSKYDKEYERLRGRGLSKWEAVKMARQKVYYGFI